jgi:adenosylcobyric acid synthase
VELLYSNSPADIENADIVIVPGTKNTVKDLLYLKEKGLDKSLWRAYSKGVEIIGICGGYQILGRKLFDPYCVESECKEIDGIGLLNIETTFQKEKVTAQVNAEPIHTFPTSQVLKGYEIHMGVSSGDIGLFRIERQGRFCENVIDGSINGNCWGTYIHGIFENDSFRRAIINNIRKNKGLPLLDSSVKYLEIMDRAIDNLTHVVEENVDINFIKGLIEL